MVYLGLVAWLIGVSCRKEGLFVVGDDADFKLLYTHEPIPIVQQKHDLGTLRHRYCLVELYFYPVFSLPSCF